MRTTRVSVMAIVAAGAAGIATVGSAMVGLSPASASQSGRHQLAGSRPAWQTHGNFQKTGTLPAATRVAAKVWLSANDRSGLAALASDLSDPASASYGQYLTHDEYVARFAPTQDQVAQVEDWLKSAGLTVTSVGPDNHYVAVSGSSSAVSDAFGTTMSTYRFQGKTVPAPDSALSVPATVGSTVLAVTGLTPAGHRVSPHQSEPADLGAPAGFVNATPCSDYYGQKDATDQPKFHGRTLPYAVCGYTPRQLRSVYGAERGGTGGAGQTVAIVDAYDASTLRSDANTYAVRQGDRPFFGNQFQDRSVAEDASTEADCGGNGWYGEQTLDIEAVHGMAPAANVLYYGAASCYDDDLLASLA